MPPRVEQFSAAELDTKAEEIGARLRDTITFLLLRRVWYKVCHTAKDFLHTGWRPIPFDTELAK